MESPYFKPIPADLPETEAAARLKRQRHAEWGIAVASMGGAGPKPELLHELQRYIDGELTIEQIAQLPYSPEVQKSPAIQAILTRERLSSAA
ncbi:hypothetical protein [Hymenobacter cellulosivorans]|uniref:Antitoxin VbhA domain-containing protein n=1 Tax=Hymenobacter cellulosivorans TaxID=2932249 RepID=A0ABY4F4V9_9BACT|nr:hypothetical protein [Hymenobacter cellulosivorans]UOQ51697.1 hypothetical protein MUN80_18265 [Hymenobacter cellulosivorans]